jgi:glyoxylase-like metal-dependent hydrolase (beta-lactamase superfamily II)
MKRRLFAVSSVLAVLLHAAGAAQAQTNPNSHLLSADNLIQVSAHVWMIKGSPNIGIVVGKRATLVVDDGLGTKNGQMIADAAVRLSPKGQKLYLTTTHYHAEHATGDGGFPPGTILIRPRAQQAELEAEGQKLIDIFSSRSAEDRSLLQDFRYQKPDVLFDSDYRLDLGDVQVRLMWFGPAHTKGDELIMVEPDGVLISGDVIQNKASPYFYCSECTPRKWLAVVDKAAAQLHPKIIMPDHSPPGDISLIAENRAFLTDLQTRTAALKSEGKSAEEAGKLLTADMQAKYPGWSGINRVQQAVVQGYADNGD